MCAGLFHGHSCCSCSWVLVLAHSRQHFGHSKAGPDPRSSLVKGSLEEPRLDALCIQLEWWGRNSSLEPCTGAALPTQSFWNARTGRDGAQQPAEHRAQHDPHAQDPHGPLTLLWDNSVLQNYLLLNKQRQCCHVQESEPETTQGTQLQPGGVSQLGAFVYWFTCEEAREEMT